MFEYERPPFICYLPDLKAAIPVLAFQQLEKIKVKEKSSFWHSISGLVNSKYGPIFNKKPERTHNYPLWIVLRTQRERKNLHYLPDSHQNNQAEELMSKLPLEFWFDNYLKWVPPFHVCTCVCVCMLFSEAPPWRVSSGLLMSTSQFGIASAQFPAAIASK